MSALDLERLRGRWDDAHLFPSDADRFFRADRFVGDLDTALDPSFSVLTVVAGSGRLRGDGGGLDLQAGGTVVVPAGAGSVRLVGTLQLLRCRPPASGARVAGYA